MKKLVLAIIGIMCVQFVFVHYMTLQSPLGASVAPVNMETGVPGGAPFEDEQPDSSSEAEDDIPVAVASVIPNRPLPQPKTTVLVDRKAKQTVRQSADQKQIFAAPPRMAAPADFETIVIRYNDDARLADCEPRQSPQPKRRTYTAKAILKKPWDWMKAIGSKFN